MTDVDAAKPKKTIRKTSGYQVFAKEYRTAGFIDEQSSLGEASKRIALAWKEEENKKSYEAKAQEMNASLPASTAEKPKKKFFTTAFLEFSKEERPKISTQSPEWCFAQVSKEVGRKWKDLAASDKGHWESVAATKKTAAAAAEISVAAAEEGV